MCVRPELHTTLFIAYVVVLVVVAQGGVSGRLGLLLLPVAAVRSRGFRLRGLRGRRGSFPSVYFDATGGILS